METIRTRSQLGRIEYVPSWSRSKPWNVYYRGTAINCYAALDLAMRWLRDQGESFPFTVGEYLAKFKMIPPEPPAPPPPALMQRPIRVHLADGTSYETTINGPDGEIRRYFIGHDLQFGDTEAKPFDDLRKVVDVEFLDKTPA